MLTAQPFAATPRTDSSVSGSSHSPSLEKKPEASHSVSHSATGPSPGDGCQPGIRSWRISSPCVCLMVGAFRFAPPHWHYCSPGRCACSVEVPE